MPSIDVRKVRSLGPNTHVRLAELLRRYVKRGEGVVALAHAGRTVKLNVEVKDAPAQVKGRVGFVAARFTSVPSGRAADDDEQGVAFEVLCATRAAEIGYIGSIPSHNIPSGTFALDMVLAFARAIGCKTARLEDASYLRCPGSEESVSLRRILLLTRGVGWYESRGFRTDLHSIRPGWQERVVTRAMAIPVAGLRDYFGRVYDAVRAALAGGGRGTGKLQVLSLWLPSDGKQFEPAREPLKASLELLGRAEAVLEACRGTRCKTLGTLVRQISGDCLAVEALTSALMPWERIHILKTDDRGRAVPTPRWLLSILDLRTVEAFTDMVIDL